MAEDYDELNKRPFTSRTVNIICFQLFSSSGLHTYINITHKYLAHPLFTVHTSQVTCQGNPQCQLFINIFWRRKKLKANYIYGAWRGGSFVHAVKRPLFVLSWRVHHTLISSSIQFLYWNENWCSGRNTIVRTTTTDINYFFLCTIHLINTW